MHWFSYYMFASNIRNDSTIVIIAYTVCMHQSGDVKCAYTVYNESAIVYIVRKHYAIIMHTLCADTVCMD